MPCSVHQLNRGGARGGSQGQPRMAKIMQSKISSSDACARPLQRHLEHVGREGNPSLASKDEVFGPGSGKAVEVFCNLLYEERRQGNDAPTGRRLRTFHQGGPVHGVRTTLLNPEHSMIKVHVLAT